MMIKNCNRLSLVDFIYKRPPEVFKSPHENIENYLTSHIIRQALATANYLALSLLGIRAMTLEAFIFTFKNLSIFASISLIGNLIGTQAVRDVRQTLRHLSPVSPVFGIACEICSMSVVVYMAFFSYQMFEHIFGKDLDLIFKFIGVLCMNALFVPVVVHMFWFFDFIRWKNEILGEWKEVDRIDRSRLIE